MIEELKTDAIVECIDSHPENETRILKCYIANAAEDQLSAILLCIKSLEEKNEKLRADIIAAEERGWAFALHYVAEHLCNPNYECYDDLILLQSTYAEAKAEQEKIK